jgi:hypothetical protein
LILNNIIISNNRYIKLILNKDIFSVIIKYLDSILVFPYSSSSSISDISSSLFSYNISIANEALLLLINLISSSSEFDSLSSLSDVLVSSLNVIQLFFNQKKENEIRKYELKNITSNKEQSLASTNYFPSNFLMKLVVCVQNIIRNKNEKNLSLVINYLSALFYLIEQMKNISLCCESIRILNVLIDNTSYSPLISSSVSAFFGIKSLCENTTNFSSSRSGEIIYFRSKTANKSFNYNNSADDEMLVKINEDDSDEINKNKNTTSVDIDKPIILLKCVWICKKYLDLLKGNGTEFIENDDVYLNDKENIKEINMKNNVYNENNTPFCSFSYFSSVLEFLGNFLVFDDLRSQLCIDCGVIEIFINVIKKINNPIIVSEAMLGLCNLCSGSEKQVLFFFVRLLFCILIKRLILF